MASPSSLGMLFHNLMVLKIRIFASSQVYDFVYKAVNSCSNVHGADVSHGDIYVKCFHWKMGIK